MLEAVNKQKFTMHQDFRSGIDAYKKFKCPKIFLGKHIQLCRPYAVMSVNTYSNAITLPMGIAYLGAVLEKANFSVKMIDALGSSRNKIRTSKCGTYNFQGLDDDEIIRRIDPKTKIFGISLMFSQEWVPHRELIKKIKKKFPDIIIVAGGEHPTAMPEYILKDCKEIDYIILGEGEFTFLELVHRIASKKQIQDTAGLAFFDRNKKFTNTGLSKRIAYINDIPWPAWHLFNVESYFSGNWTMGISRGRNMPILGTRGCPYQCTFCSNPRMWTTRYTMRNVTDVVNEIQFLIQQYNANSIEFYDLTAIVKKEWILEFCKELENRKINISWQLPSGTRSEALDFDTLSAIYKTGCDLLVYAPESGSENSLKLIKKKLKLKNLTKSAQTAVKIGHNVKINMIIGFPHENYFDIFKSIFYGIKMALIGVHDCNYATFTPYPGSEIYDELLEKKKISKPSDKYFTDLLVQFDLTRSTSYCEKIPGKMLSFLRFLALSSYYTTVYLRYPNRVMRIFRIIFDRKFMADSVFEQRISDIFARKKLLKENSN